MTAVRAQLEEGKTSTRHGDLVQGGRSVLATYGGIIDKYAPPIPSAFFAVRIWVECRGNPKATASAGQERGLLQLWPWAVEKYGVTDPFDPEQNIKAGCQMYHDGLKSLKAWLNANHYRTDGDLLGCIWLYWAIGSGILQHLLKGAVQVGSNPFTAVQSYLTTASGERYLTAAASKGYCGSQSADLVAWRVGFAAQAMRAVDILQTEDGEMSLSWALLFGLICAIVGILLYQWAPRLYS